MDILHLYSLYLLKLFDIKILVSLVLKVALEMDEAACHTGWLFRRCSPE